MAKIRRKLTKAIKRKAVQLLKSKNKVKKFWEPNEEGKKNIKINDQ